MLGLILYPALTIMFWILYVGILVFGIALIWLMWLTSQHDNAATWIIIILLSPLLVPTFILAVVSEWLWTHAIKPMYFRRHKYLRVAWLSSLAAISALIYLFWGSDTLLKVWLVVGGTILACIGVLVFAFLIIEGIPALWRWMASLRQPHRMEYAAPRRPGISTKQLLKEYRKTKWGSIICPFINLPHQWE